MFDIKEEKIRRSINLLRILELRPAYMSLHMFEYIKKHGSFN